MVLRKFLILAPIVVILLSGCGGPAAAQQPEPTAMPPAPELERPTYTVQQGSVERVLEATGRVSPVDLERLAFSSGGRVAVVHVQRGDTVAAGDVLAEILHDEALDALRRAEVGLAQAERDLEEAAANREREVAQARLGVGEARSELSAAAERRAEALGEAERELQRAEADLAELTAASGPQSLIERAERALAEARRAAEVALEQASTQKTSAEHARIAASEAVERAQTAYSDAFWDADWVEHHNTHPREKVADPVTGEQRHRELAPHEREQFRRALAEAGLTLAEAERKLELAVRDVDLAHAAEAAAQQKAERDLGDAARALARAQAGQGDATLAQARRRVEDAQIALGQARSDTLASAESSLARANLALEAAQAGSLDSAQTRVEEARLDLEQARRQVDAGRVIAPQDGVVLAVGVGVGDLVEAYEPAIEIGDPNDLEVAVELSRDQLRLLAEGQPAEVALVARPDLTLPATIRRLPAPYGSGGSGAVAEQDTTSRFRVEGSAAELSLGAVARVRVGVERVDDALWLPPEAIRSFEGRRFVVVRTAEGERRVAVELGIASDERVEIKAGLEAGDVVVGP